MANYPDHAQKIQSEIEHIDVRTDLGALQLLPHINGVINEVLRLVPPAMTGLSRITGPQGLIIDGTFIPPNTKVTAPKYVVMRCKVDSGDIFQILSTAVTDLRPSGSSFRFS